MGDKRGLIPSYLPFYLIIDFYILKQKGDDLMPKIFIVYYSNTGNTEKMAESIEKGAKEEGIDVIRKQVGKTRIRKL